VGQVIGQSIDEATFSFRPDFCDLTKIIMFDRNIQYLNKIQLTNCLDISPDVNKPPVIIITAATPC
jgi:hypothetical protein